MRDLLQNEVFALGLLLIELYLGNSGGEELWLGLGDCDDPDEKFRKSLAIIIIEITMYNH